jgi:hypothetical protein
MSDPSMLQIAHNGFTYSAEHAFQCNGCGAYLQGFVEFEGSGDEGCAHMRALMAEEGWLSDGGADTDLCPACAPADTTGEQHDAGR